MKNPKAFIFDLDGVITDTAEYHFKAWKDLADSIGIEIDRQFNECLKGVSRLESLERILKHGNKESDFTDDEKQELAFKKNEDYKVLINQVTPDEILPNIMELLIELRKNEIKIGLASASKNAKKVVELLELNDYFDYIADAALIENSKPAPDVFLDVMNHFNLTSDDCIGIEDAGAGIVAINAANMFSVGIGKRSDLVGADIIYPSTSNLTFSKVIEAYNK